MKKLIQGEEWQPLHIGGSDGLQEARDVELLLKAWERKTGLSSTAFFERRHNILIPKSWSGTIETPRFQLEVAPIGTSLLSPPEKGCLERTLSFMMAGATSPLVLTGLADVSIKGFRHEALISTFCDELLLARRKQILRRYAPYTDSRLTPKGRISFPAQCYESIRRPSRFLSSWVELSEDLPENRLFKETLRRSRPRCSAQLRGKIDLCLSFLDNIPYATDVLSEIAKLRQDKLPVHYKSLLLMCRALLDGKGSGLFHGDIFTSSHVLFTSRLFEFFSFSLFAAYATAYGFLAKQHPRGTYLFHRESGAGSFEQIPDILLSNLNGTNKVIIDAKWKSIDVKSKNYGINSSDINQILVYAAKYECTDIVLLYPDITKETGRTGVMYRNIFPLGKQTFSLYVMKMPLLVEGIADIKLFFNNALSELRASVYS